MQLVYWAKGHLHHRMDAQLQSIYRKNDSIHVWVNLYALLIEFWGERIFTKIGKTIGIYRYMDIQTKEDLSKKLMLCKARLAISMEISSSWPQSITLSSNRGIWSQKIEYENFSMCCYDCQQDGHIKNYPRNRLIKDLGQRGKVGSKPIPS